MSMPGVRELTQVRSEFASARVICSNLEHRASGRKFCRHPGYIPAEIDVLLDDGAAETLSVRDADVRFLDRVAPSEALWHADLIRRSRRGDRAAAEELDRRTLDTLRRLTARFAAQELTEDAYVLPYTTKRPFGEESVSHKGAILLDLSRRGFATADFSILTADAFRLPGADLEDRVRAALRNVEILSGRRLGDPGNPLLVAVRSALPEYIPGFMPTFLNAGLTAGILPGLPDRYGADGAARIRLNARKTLLEALDPEAAAGLEGETRSFLSRAQNEDLAGRMEDLIARRDERLLDDALGQVLFYIRGAYAYYTDHLGVLRNFMPREARYPAVILQRMVCSVIDERSYAGVLYSRHPQRGAGVFLQFGRAIYGEDLMTGRLRPEEHCFQARDEVRWDFPAVYHFWDRLGQLEDLFRGPVMVEFTGVHGTFTVLQVNAAELSGAGMLTAVMEMHRAGRLPPDRVRELIKPYHIRQIESDAIDPRSLHDLTPIARGAAVLPRSAVTGRLCFSAARADQAHGEWGGAPLILAKARFTPQDTIDMQRMGGICSLSPAAIHVVTTAQNLGIPALLNLEESGVRIDAEKRVLFGRDGVVVREGDWVTISSRYRTLYAGRAVFAPARLLRFMSGEAVEIDPADRPRFERLAADYAAFRRILESVDAGQFGSLQDLGHAIRYGGLRGDEARAAEFVNRCFDVRSGDLVAHLLESTLGTHLINGTAYGLLTPDRRIRLLHSAAAICLERGLSGYLAGAFIIGSLVDPGAPLAFWKSFSPREIAFLLNEWVLHRKYLHVLEEVGERRISRAKNFILSRGLGAHFIPEIEALDFLPLKLGGTDLDELRARLPEGADAQTVEVVEALRRPFGELFDYDDPARLDRLRRVCEREGLPLPEPASR